MNNRDRAIMVLAAAAGSLATYKLRKALRHRKNKKKIDIITEQIARLDALKAKNNDDEMVKGIIEVMNEMKKMNLKGTYEKEFKDIERNMNVIMLMKEMDSKKHEESIREYEKTEAENIKKIKKYFKENK